MSRRLLPLLLAACSPAAPVTVDMKAMPSSAVIEASPAVIEAPTGTPRPATAGWRSFADGERFGFKDAQGQVVLAPRYVLAQEFTPGGLACVVDHDGWVCIDGHGAPQLRPFIVDNGPDEFAEGLARFVEGEQVGFFDEAGRKQIPARFSFARPFADGRAAFCAGCTRHCEADGEHCGMRGGKWGLIDRNGAEIVAASFDEIGPFEGGVAHAVKDGQPLTIDRDGRAR